MTYTQRYYREHKHQWKLYALTQKSQPNYRSRMALAQRLYKLRYPEKIKAYQEKCSREKIWRKYYYGNIEIQRERRKVWSEKKRRMSGARLKSEMVGPQHPRWTGGPKKCVDCGIQLKNRSRTSKRCQPCKGRFFSGPRSWSWKGGHTSFRKALYGTAKYKQWRQHVFERDQFTCQMCHRSGKYLEAHHKTRMIVLLKEFIPRIDELPGYEVRDRALTYEPLWDIANGVTLCRDCHKEESRHDKMLIEHQLRQMGLICSL